MCVRRSFFALVFSLTTLSAANADIILIDPNGGGSGGPYAVGSIDFLQGNSLADQVLTGGVGHQWTLYYQAVLGSLVDPIGNVITGTGLNSSYQITAVAGVTVETVSISPSTFVFERAAAPTTNFLRLYYDSSVNANALAGTGYNDGLLILDTTANNDMFGFLTFQGGPSVALDQFNVNNWPGTLTRPAVGAFAVSAEVLYADPLFFSTVNPLDTIAMVFTNSSEVLPYRETDPSVQFWDGAGFIPSQVGAINGLSGPDALVQADANASFQVEAIPEASSLILGGLAMSLFAAFGIRRRKAAR